MTEVRDYVSLPEKLEPAPKDPRRGRLYFLIGCVVFGVVTVFSQNWLWILAGVLVATVVGPLGYKRYRHEPGYLVPFRAVRDLFHKLRNGSFYENDDLDGDEPEGDDTNGKTSKKGEGLFTKVAPINIHLTTFPVELESEMPTYVDENGEEKTEQVDSIAVLHDPSLNRDVTVITYEGRTTQAASGPARMAADLAFADAIVAPLFVSSNRGSIAHGIRTRPLNMGRYNAATAPRLSDAVSNGLSRLATVGDEDFVPQNADERLALMEAQKAALIRDKAHDPINWIAYSVDRPKGWVRGKLSDQVDEYDLVHSTLVQLAQQAEESLAAAGAFSPIALDIWGMSRFIKGALDLDIAEWSSVMDNLLGDPSVNPYEDERCWPWPNKQIFTRVDRHDEPFLDIDGTLHRVWVQVARDDRRIYPETYSPIFESGDIGVASQTGLAVTAVGDVFSADSASKALDTRILFEQVLGEVGKDPNRHVSDREARLLSKGVELQRQIDNGGKNGFFNNLYCVTSAIRDPRLLEEVDEVLLQHARTVGLTLESIKSPTIALQKLKLAMTGVPSA